MPASTDSKRGTKISGGRSLGAIKVELSFVRNLYRLQGRDGAIADLQRDEPEACRRPAPRARSAGSAKLLPAGRLRALEVAQRLPEMLKPMLKRV